MPELSTPPQPQPIKYSKGSLPCRAGISLKFQHFEQLLEEQPDIAWLEIHPENYMGEGGLPHHHLSLLSQHYPISMHSVGMSLGSEDGLDQTHLDQLMRLIERYEPAMISDHLSWSRYDGKFLNDLLPLPYSDESLEVLSENIQKVQSLLGQQILIENPSVYLDMTQAKYTEGEFIKKLIEYSNCGLLLDINNIYVSANNQGLDPAEQLNEYPLAYAQEIHLAGHAKTQLEDGSVLRIDDHGSAVCDEVWQLYQNALVQLNKPVATLIEWDTNVPELDQLLQQAAIAESILSTANQFSAEPLIDE